MSINANMEEDVASCIIHFGDVSSEILRQFTAVSLSKFIYCRKIWLGLTGAQNEVAVKSLEYFTELDEERFSGDGTIPQRGLQYHVECYRKFTDKTKIERAQRAAKSSGEGEMSEPVAKKTKGKEKAEEYKQQRSRTSTNRNCPNWIKINACPAANMLNLQKGRTNLH